MKHLFPNVAAVVLAVAMPAYAQTSNTKPAARGAPSAAEAKAFVDNAERDLANVSDSDLHCYVRAKLNEKYGDAVQSKTGPIRADLLGNMWSQEWGNIYDVVTPKDGAGLGYDLTKQLEAKGYTPQSMVKTAENFYISLGFDPWPKTFWERSVIVRPRDREVQCHASAWDIDNKDDIRLKACIHVNADDFFTVHHELGHNLYQRAYKNQPFLFQNGANDGFHEAIGDFRRAERADGRLSEATRRDRCHSGK